MQKLSELEFDENDLDTVARFLAPHYGRTAEQQKIIMGGTVLSSGADLSVETGGFIAVKVNNKVRFFIGNHLIRCEGVLSIKKGKKRVSV